MRSWILIGNRPVAWARTWNVSVCRALGMNTLWLKPLSNTRRRSVTKRTTTRTGKPAVLWMVTGRIPLLDVRVTVDPARVMRSYTPLIVRVAASMKRAPATGFVRKAELSDNRTVSSN